MLEYSAQPEARKAEPNSNAIANPVIILLHVRTRNGGNAVFPTAWRNKAFHAPLLNSLCSVNVPLSTECSELVPLACLHELR
jgi:hypothetical protein